MSILHWCGAEFHSCGYCKSANGSISHGLWAESLTVDDYQAMVDRGWRRSGKYCYKPVMDQTCCPQYTIRCEALKFHASKSQKKVIKKLNRFLRSGLMPPPLPPSATGDAFQDEDEDAVDGFAGIEDPPVELNAKCVTMEVSRLAAKPSKEVKPGLGADSSKPRCKKAKILRRERKHLLRPSEPGPEGKHSKEKSLLELLLAPCGDGEVLQNKLEIKLISLDKTTWQMNKQHEFEVYKKYQVRIHQDAPAKCTMSSFERFLVHSPLESTDPALGSFHQQYWLNGRLIAVGVLDVLPHCVSSVYFFYDPDFQQLSLGTYSALREIEFACQMNETHDAIRYYYMGYYIHTCPKMQYKARLRPSALLCPETYRWTPVQEALALLERARYARLCADAAAEDADACSLQQLQQLKMIGAAGYRTLRHYAHRQRHDATLQTLRAILGATLIRSVFIVDFQI